MSTQSLTFRIASEEWEFEQIHQLNYKTFVEEIPQHPPNPQRALVDKFHHENTYLIGLRGWQLVGMVAVRDTRPFSLDSKLDDLDTYLPPHRSLCELRLLAVEKEYRNPRVFQGLMLRLAQYGELQGYDLAVMSGTVRQLKLYRQLGFVPFGPLVGTPDAMYQPMYFTLEAYQVLNKKSKAFRYSSTVASTATTPVNFLPGPVAMAEPVRKTYSELPVSHRSKAFMEVFAQTKRLLCQLAGARAVEIFTGSGMLANDVIAGQLSLMQRVGLILANGEFGGRLIDHATRFGLSFHVLRAAWGQPFESGDIQRILDEKADIGWLWAVHCETSSGILNDVSLLQHLCFERDILLCLDCISSLGTISIDLSHVYLASGASGKGLRAFPGLSMVFYNHEVSPAPDALPRSLDLGLYASYDGVPFTISSNLLYA
ncbi:MAG: aminotransferase class V-fold PLP-dependent enzyme, partial [Chloroflexota bacterium]|nr:aminotransferase class V-fold PLP-dependent enzyme [Chloroflexota bacterium]